MASKLVSTGIVLLLMVSLGSPCARAQTVKTVPARPIQSVEGADSFKEYCAVCHGQDAKGNGPAASALKTPPPDLTTIVKRKGTFSDADVVARISGKNLSPAHGSSEMPIWGHVFDALQGDAGVSTLRVRNLVDYIKSIQAK